MKTLARLAPALGGFALASSLLVGCTSSTDGGGGSKKGPSSQPASQPSGS
jgi:hypothetical protein